MDRIRAATLAFALSVALTSPALACRDAREGKPWRPQDAAPGAVVQTIDVAKDDTKDFFIGAVSPGRLHICVRMAVSDPKDQSGAMGMLLWVRSSRDFYEILFINARLQIIHRLSGKKFVLMPPTGFAAAKNGGDRMIEVDVRANDSGADIEIDGTRAANIIARPPADATGYSLRFVAFDKPSSFRLGPVLTFGDGQLLP